MRRPAREALARLRGRSRQERLLTARRGELRPILARTEAGILKLSVIQIKIQQVPVEEKPEKSHTSDSEERVPNLVPDPLPAITP